MRHILSLIFLLGSFRNLHQVFAKEADSGYLKQYLEQLDVSAISNPKICEINVGDFVKTGQKISKGTIENLNKYAAKKYFQLHLIKNENCRVELNNKDVPKSVSIDQEWINGTKLLAAFYQGALCEGVISVINTKLAQLNKDTKVVQKDSIYEVTDGQDSITVDTAKNTLSIKVYSSSGRLKQTDIGYRREGKILRPSDVVVNTPHNGQRIENHLEFGAAIIPIRVSAKIYAQQKVFNGEFILENCRSN